MPNKHGDFIWYELTTSDADAAKDFYSAVLGWTWETSEGQPDMPYYLFSMNDTQVGGMMALTDEMRANGAVPAWLGYIAVDDVDKSAEAIKAAGGAVHIPPTDIPDVGRFAMVNDPQGAFFYIMRGASDEESHSFAATEPKVGHCAWNELLSSDPEAAIAFYSEQFGWEKVEEMDMPPMGKYHMLGHGYGLGGVMQKPEQMPIPAWTFYFRVPDIDAALVTVKDKGGQVFTEPMEIPGDEYTINAMDPQGAPFALVGKRL
ncbi:MAG: VOC family protein [Parasphingopyxis sp.]|uniref:VOC family protein n=1 Tax=Parasphingopyxis sp. TaxID=1920299 RepID=UPI003F9FF718